MKRCVGTNGGTCAKFQTEKKKAVVNQRLFKGAWRKRRLP